MIKAQKRFSALTSFVFNATLVLLLAIFLTSFVTRKPVEKANLVINRINRGPRTVSVHFTPNLNLSNQFTYNVKQVFLYLRVINPSKKNHSEIFWSKIVQRNDNYDFKRLQISNYDVRDKYTTKMIFELRGNIFPYVGVVRDVLHGTFVLDL